MGLIKNAFMLKTILLNCGAYRIEKKENSEDLTTLIMEEYLPNGGTEEELEWINALSYMNEQFPPVYLMTATDDFLRNQAPIMRKKLDELQIPYQYKVYGTRERPLGHVFHCDIKSEDAKICNLEECEFLKRFTIKKMRSDKEC